MAMPKPVGYKVLILPDPIEEQSKGGIVLMSSEYEAKLEKAGQEKGTIVAIGPLAWKAHEVGHYGEHIGKPWAKVGDRVQYSKYGGRPTKDEVTGEEYMLVADEDVQCVL